MSVERDPVVKILLCIHDGEPYLPELLASVAAQTYQRWELLVCDDGSRDAGRELVERFALADERVRVVVERRPGDAIGPAASFVEMLGHVDAGELFAFCDQDDVWFAHKLRWTVDALGEVIADAAANADADNWAGRTSRIAAVSTDAVMTDDSMRVVAGSALREHGVRNNVTFGRLLVNNVAIGATIVGTAELARCAHASAQRREVRMHDWWCALIAAYAGAFGIVAVPTMSWRRHSATVTGRRPEGVRARAVRRNDALAWSSSAAAALESDLVAIDRRTADAARLVAGLGGRPPGVRDTVRLARAGIRPWTAAGWMRLALAVVMRRFGT